MTRQFPLGGDRSDAFRYRVGVLREPAGRGGPAYIHDVLQRMRTRVPRPQRDHNVPKSYER